MTYHKKNLKIDFIGIGVGKAATSWIYSCLGEHPQICASRPKETYFFLKGYYKENLTNYKSCFKHCKIDQIKGEFTPTYFHDKETPFLIKKHFPNIKLILCLRNPIDKIYSHFYFRKTRGKVLQPTLEKALENNELDEELKQGFYYADLCRYLKYFPLKDIFIIFYEDIENNPVQFIQNIYKFLDVNENFTPKSIDKKINALSKDRLFIPFVNSANAIKLNLFFEKYWLGRIIIKIAQKTKTRSFIRWLMIKNIKDNVTAFKKPIAKAPIDPKTKEYLWKIYKEDIKKLEKLLNKDLNFWKQE